MGRTPSTTGGCDYRFVRNTILGTWQSAIASYIDPIDGVVLEENAFVGRALSTKKGQEAAAFGTWQVRRNWFTETYRVDGKEFFGSERSNRTGPLPFLSTDPTNRNYLRLDATQLPKDPAGQPLQFGALPPGPAPPEGDWFTRLLERWQETLEESPAPDDKAGQPKAN